MKILVPVKRVDRLQRQGSRKADGRGVEPANVKMSMNPFDEIAVEEALRLKEAGRRRSDRRIHRVQQCQETIRTRWPWAPIAASWS